MAVNAPTFRAKDADPLISQPFQREVMDMRNGLSFCLAVLLLSCAAQAKTGASHQSATVIGVQKHEVESSWVGSNGSDAPVRADGYLYDVALKVDCAIYVVRYQSSFDQPPPIFAPDRRVDVRVEKHVLYATMPGGEDAKMAILKRGTDSGVQCGGRSARSQPSVQARLVR